VSRTLETNHAREVATLGIIRIATTPEKYVERLADIATFKRTDDVLQIGTFSDPPQIDDVAGRLRKGTCDASRSAVSTNAACNSRRKVSNNSSGPWTGAPPTQQRARPV
jgi:hypothetical protein